MARAAVRTLTDRPNHWLITYWAEVNCDLVNFIFPGRPNVWRMPQAPLPFRGQRLPSPSLSISSINTTVEPVWIIPEGFWFIKPMMEILWHLPRGGDEKINACGAILATLLGPRSVLSLMEPNWNSRKHIWWQSKTLTNNTIKNKGRML